MRLFMKTFKARGNGETPPVTPPDGTTAAANAGGTEELKDTMTKAEVEAVIKKRLDREGKKAKELLEQLDKVKNLKSMTEAEKAQLEENIRTLQLTFTSKEEIAANEKKALEAKMKGELDLVLAENKQLKQKYEDHVISHALTNAAVVADAVRPQQLVTILRSNTRLVDEIKDGKSTGNQSVLVKFEGRTSEGQSTVFELPVDEAVKTMKNTPDLYGNLFKSGVNGGAGGTTLSGAVPSNEDLRDPAKYMANRQKLLGKK